MKPHDETLAHKKAIALAFAEDQNSVQYGSSGHYAPDLCQLHSKPFSYSIKPKPLAPGHNPDNLTVEKVGEGWRLLDCSEVKGRDRTLPLERWDNENNRWDDRQWFGELSNRTYRTRLSREQLALLDKQEGWIPWFGEGEIPTGMVEYCSRDEGVNPSLDERCEAEQLDWTITNEGGDIIAYRPVKQPTVVPWNCADDVPATCWLRSKGERQWMALVVMVNGARVSFASESATAIASRTYDQLSDYEHSTDRINWFPCNKKSGVKGEK